MPLNYVDVAALTIVTASSTSQVGPCQSNPGSCQPANVLFPNAKPTSQEPSTRWQSAPEWVARGQPCTPQSLTFDGSLRPDKPFALDYITILYGELGFQFDGFRNYPPTIEVDYQSGIKARLEQNVEFTFSTGNHSVFTNRRLDTLTFKRDNTWNTDIMNWKLVWNNLFPYGSYDQALCQINVEEVHISAASSDRDPTSGTSGGQVMGGNGPKTVLPVGGNGSGSSGSNSNSNEGGMSGGAIAALILLPLILIPVAVVFYIRRKNIKRRMDAAKTLLRAHRLDSPSRGERENPFADNNTELYERI